MSTPRVFAVGFEMSYRGLSDTTIEKLESSEPGALVVAGLMVMGGIQNGTLRVEDTVDQLNNLLLALASTMNIAKEID